MIKIIGIGLWDERSMTIKAQEEAADCDIIYAEFYTSKMFGSTLKKLEKKIGKEIQELSREEVESGKEILKKAKKQKVGLLVGIEIVSFVEGVVSFSVDFRRSKSWCREQNNSRSFNYKRGSRTFRTASLQIWEDCIDTFRRA